MSNIDTAFITEVFDPQGNKAMLGEKMASGGEGAVYPISGRNSTLVKIYHTDILKKRGLDLNRKIEVMVDMKETHSMLWLRVGDGALVVQEHLKNTVNVVNTNTPFVAVCRSLGVAEKGEFANETVFLDSVQPSDIQFGWMSVSYVSSVAAMSDGASEKLVSNDGLQIAPKLERLFDTLQQDKLQRQHLTSMFYDSSFCEKSTGDDRCLALLARDWKAVNLNEKTTPSVTVVTVEDALPPSPQPTNALRSSVNEISSTRKIQKRQRERKKGSI